MTLEPCGEARGRIRDGNFTLEDLEEAPPKHLLLKTAVVAPEALKLIRKC